MDLTMSKMENKLLAWKSYWKWIFDMGEKPFFTDWPFEVIIPKGVHNCECQIPVVPRVESNVQQKNHYSLDIDIGSETVFLPLLSICQAFLRLRIKC